MAGDQSASADLTMHVLQLDMGVHSAHTPGELLERIDGDRWIGGLRE